MKTPKLKPGMRFGKLVTIKQVDDKIYGIKNKRVHECWLCKCDCGNTIEVVEWNLINKNTTTCGCYRLDKEPATVHGLSKTRINKMYRDMKYRCSDHENISRGNMTYKNNNIKICDDWLGKDGFMNFYQYAISHGYDDTLTIDRIDPLGNYEPGNIRFVDKYTQANNKINNKYIKYNDDKFTVADWAKALNHNVEKLYNRIKSGHSEKEVLLGKDNKPDIINGIYFINSYTNRPIPQSQIDSGNSDQFRTCFE